MLLPALNKARDKAKAISCVSNLKQISLAITQYADSYEGYIVPINLTGNTGNALWWNNLLIDGKFIPAGIWVDKGWGRIKGGSWQCPSIAIPSWHSGLGMSVAVANFGHSCKMNKVKEPSIRSMCGDTPDIDGSAYSYVYAPNPPTYLWAGDRRMNRHNGGANIGFVDGHVEWMQESLLRKNNNGLFTSYTSW
jgi:prepilin-type processing-associated H-X9-DG protein